MFTPSPITYDAGVTEAIRRAMNVARKSLVTICEGLPGIDDQRAMFEVLQKYGRTQADMLDRQLKAGAKEMFKAGALSYSGPNHSAISEARDAIAEGGTTLLNPGDRQTYYHGMTSWLTQQVTTLRNTTGATTYGAESSVGSSGS